nr:helix-turn-helix domain-containing protein [Streptomyces mexicanus]
MPNKTPVRRITPGPDRDQTRGRPQGQVRHGKSIRALAEEPGRSYGAVHRLLEDAKTTLRSTGAEPRAVPGHEPCDGPPSMPLAPQSTGVRACHLDSGAEWGHGGPAARSRACGGRVSVAAAAPRNRAHPQVGRGDGPAARAGGRLLLVGTHLGGGCHRRPGGGRRRARRATSSG